MNEQGRTSPSRGEGKRWDAESRHRVVERVRNPKSLDQRLTVAAIAGKEKVSRSTIYKWVARAEEGGEHALRDRKRSGCPRKVGQDREEMLARQIVEDAFADHKGMLRLWGLDRISSLLRDCHGIGNLQPREAAQVAARIGIDLAAAKPKSRAGHEDHIVDLWRDLRESAFHVGAQLVFLTVRDLRSGSPVARAWEERAHEMRRRGCAVACAYLPRQPLLFRIYPRSRHVSGVCGFLNQIRRDRGKRLLVVCPSSGKLGLDAIATIARRLGKGPCPAHLLGIPEELTKKIEGNTRALWNETRRDLLASWKRTRKQWRAAGQVRSADSNEGDAGSCGNRQLPHQ